MLDLLGAYQSSVSDDSNSDENEGEEEFNIGASDTVESSEEEEEPLQWNLMHNFETGELLDDFLKNEKCWATRSTQTLKCGFKTIHRCNFIPVNDPNQCAASMYTLRTVILKEGEEKTVYQVYRNNRAHTHHLHANVKVKYNQIVIDKVIDLHKQGKKPQTIIFNLRGDNTIPDNQQPPKRTIKNWIETYERNEYGSTPLTMRELTEFIAEHEKQPTDEDTPYVIEFDRTAPHVPPPNQGFRFFISTPRLLKMAANVKILHADATHKVSRDKIRLMVIGTTDTAKAFHLLGIQVTTHETSDAYEMAFRALKDGVMEQTSIELKPKYIVADADPAIHEGARRVFGPDIDIVMCYAHVIRNVRTKYKFKDSKKNKSKLIEDLRILHLSPDEATFNKGCHLFITKWNSLEEEVTKKLEKSFFKKNKYWFIGSFRGVPKTNNALERCNGTIKLFQTEYQKLPLKKIVHKSLQIVAERSQAYKMDKEFIRDTEISHKLMQEGLTFPVQFIVDKAELSENSVVEFYLYEKRLDTPITIEAVKEIKNTEYDDFDSFAENVENLVSVIFPPDPTKWKIAKCSCKSFDQSNMCKHIISIAVAIKAYKPPNELNYDDEPLFQSKRGGTSKVRPGSALQKD